LESGFVRIWRALEHIVKVGTKDQLVKAFVEGRAGTSALKPC